MELKERLIALIERCCDEERNLYNQLSEDERAERGQPDDWSPKDVIVHLAGWKLRVAEALATARRREAPERRYDDFEDVNDQEFHQYRDTSWDKVLERASDACSQLVKEVKERDEAELQGTETLPWQEGRPLWRLIVSNGFIHPMTMHLEQVYAQRGDREYARKLAEEGAEQLSELDDSASWRGTIKYNLACHYALANDAEAAIKNLGEALALAPELTDWSKEDSDLESIRNNPGYAALYE